MEQIPGVELRLFVDGKEIEPEDGYIGSFHKLTDLLIKTKVREGHDYVAYSTTGSRTELGVKKVVAKTNLAVLSPDQLARYSTAELSQALAQVAGCSAVYDHRVKVVKKIDMDGRVVPGFHILPGQNRFSLVGFDEAEKTGYVSVWEVNITYQERSSTSADYFFAVQRVHKARCYRDDNKKVVCPRFGEWVDMMALLNTHLAESVHELPHLDELVSDRRREQELEELDHNPEYREGFGRVLWWNYGSGTGVIATGHPDLAKKLVKVYWRNVERRPRLAYLEAGELVSIAELREITYKPGFIPRHVTQFKYEAVGVKPVS